MNLVYTDEQEMLIDKIKHWFIHDTSQKPYFSYSGPAGSGKTSVIQEVINQLGLSAINHEYIACAYVGKAVLNLLQHGITARTIHSLIYYPTRVRDIIIDEYGNEKKKYKMEFILKDTLEHPYKLIIVDEATMVNDAMVRELLSFHIPIVFIGDMNQLPPVFGISSVMKYPDFTLTKIMRQAEDDPIVRLSQMVLHDEPIEYGDYGLSSVVESYEITDKILYDFDQIICGKNKTRDEINNTIRKDILGRRSESPVLGDKIICRQNNWDTSVNGIYLTNGLIGDIVDISRATASRGYYNICFEPDFMDDCFSDVKMDIKYIVANHEARKKWGISRYEKFEYGYAITVHLSQGSEYPRVLLIDEYFGDEDFMRRLRYTGITRAKKSICIQYNKPTKSYWYY